MPWISKPAPHPQAWQSAFQKTARRQAKSKQNGLWECKEFDGTCILLREWQKYDQFPQNLIFKGRNYPKYPNQMRKQIIWTPHGKSKHLTRQLSPDTGPFFKSGGGRKTHTNCFNYKLIFDSQKVKKLQSFLPEWLDWNNQLKQPLKSFQGPHANISSL